MYTSGGDGFNLVEPTCELEIPKESALIYDSSELSAYSLALVLHLSPVADPSRLLYLPADAFPSDPLAQPLVIQLGCSAFEVGCLCATCLEVGLGLAVPIDSERVPASRIPLA